MKTRILLACLAFSILFVSLISYADARGFSPFHFRLADEIVYNDLYFYVDGSKSNFKVDKGETSTFPLIITSKHNAGTIVDFHATIGNDQMGEIRFPPGVNIQLEPNTMTLNGQNQTLNITVHVSEKAPSSKYNVNLVGVWKEEGKIPDFLGTGFSLHVGRDFGNEAIPVNFFEPPLKFARDGVEPKDIPCRNALMLILKHDGTPACIREETKPRLIERGWMKTQVDVHDDETFIAGTKKLDSVQYFLSLYPDAEINVDREWYTVKYSKSGFIEQDPNRSNPTRTKNLIINLDYDGKLVPHAIECGGPVSLSVNQLEAILKHLHNPDWCFPSDQSQFEFKPKSPKEVAIENIKESILTDTSYEQWRQTIQNEVDEKNLEYFSHMVITDLKDKLEQDETPSFNLITFGYRDWCIMPGISVYHQDYEDPIYEYQIVHTCPPPSGNPNPYISIQDESDFGTFPSCQFEGQYTIWGKSFEFESQLIGSFYCNSPEKFRAPETLEIIIPQGSSDLDVKNNFVPSELEIMYGDYLKITNQDNSMHHVILFIDKHEGTAVLGIRVNSGESFTEPVYRLGTFELISWDENEKEYPWMHGIVSVKEN